MSDQFTCPECETVITCLCSSMECDLDHYIAKHMEKHNECTCDPCDDRECSCRTKRCKFCQENNG